MKAWLLALSMGTAGLCIALPAAADTLAYPDSEDASFLIDHPADWEVEPGEALGDYVTLNAPSGAVLQLRTLPGTESAVADAVSESTEYLNDTFSDVELGEPTEIKDGKIEGSMLLGRGLDEDEQEVGFAMYFLGLPDGRIAEIWYAVVKGDQEGHDAAVKILNSFRAP